MIDVDIELLKSLYIEYQSVMLVGKKLGVSHEFVRYTLKNLGLVNKPIRHAVNEDFFSMNTPQSFYWAGFVAADGCVKLHGKKCKQLSIGLAIKDLFHLEKFKSAIEYSGPIHKYENTDNKHCEVAMSSAKIFDDIARFNIVPRKSLTLTFPSWLVGHDLVHHFMRGYFDGDGSFYTQLKSGKTVSQLYFGLRGTKEFLTTYRDILESRCSFERNEKKPRANSGIYTLEYGGNRKVLKIRDFLYKDATNNTILDRKHTLAFSDQFNLPEDFKFKRVIGTDLSTGTEIVFGSMKEAETHGFRYQGISACCRGEYKHHKGYTWSYATTTSEQNQ